MLFFRKFKNERMVVMVLVSPVQYFDTLSRAQRFYGKALEPVCREYGLTRNELDVLLFLHNNPGFHRAADIVRLRGIAKSHVSLSVSALERRGLIARQFAPADRRTAHLALTESGLAIARSGRATQECFFRSLFAGISREELELWQTLVERVQNNIENL